MKRFLAALLAAVLVIAAMTLAAGCKLDETPVTEAPEGAAEIPAGETEAESEPESETDLDAAVAKVGDEVITLREYKYIFDMYVSYYTAYGMDVSADPAILAEFQKSVLDTLLTEKVTVEMAKKEGFFDITAEQQAEVDAQVEDAKAQLDEYYRSIAEDEYAKDSSVSVDDRMAEMIAEEAEHYTGEAMTIDEYYEWMAEQTKKDYCVELLENSVYETLTVSDEEISSWYDAKLAEQTEQFTADPGAYKDASENSEMFGNEPAVYVPEGYSRIMHILAAPEGTLPEEYTANATTMDTIKAEYGELAFESALEGGKDNSARMNEIITEYNGLAAKNEELNTAYFATAKTKIDEAYAKLAAGGDITALTKEYTADVDFTTYPIFMEKGMLISSTIESEVDWSDTVKAEFEKLTLGQYSEAFKDDDGYHIIAYFADEPAGVRTLETVKDSIRQALLEDKKTAEWEALLSSWRNSDMVEVYGDVYTTVGTAVG